MKRFLAVCIALCLAVALFAVPAFAEGEASVTTADELKTALANGGKIVLAGNVDINETLQVMKPVVLDLNGKTLKITALNGIQVQGDGAKLTVQDSTAVQTPSVDKGNVSYTSGKIEHIGNSSAIFLNGGAVVTLESGTVYSTAGSGIYAYGSTIPDQWNTPVATKVVVTGGVVDAQEYGIGVAGNGAALEFKGGVAIGRDNAGIAGNGSKTNKENLGGTSITISGGHVIGRISSLGYTACGIYHPQMGILNITGDASIYAVNGVGILMRNGELNVTGGTITGTGSSVGYVGDSKSTVAPAGVVIEYRNGYNHNNEQTDSRKVALQGGTFSAETSDAPVQVVQEDTKIVDDFISGGVYSADVSTLVAGGSSELVRASGNNRFVVNASTDKPASATTRTEKNGAVVYFEDVNQALNDKAANDINVVADAEISLGVPEGVKVTVASGVTLTAKGNLSGVTFSDGAKLVVPEGQTATVGGKEYASGSYEAQKDGTLSKPETKPEEKPAEPAAPAPAPAKANPKTGVRA